MKASQLLILKREKLDSPHPPYPSLMKVTFLRDLSREGNINLEKHEFFLSFIQDTLMHSCEYHCLSGYHSDYKELDIHCTKLDVPLNCTTE